MKKTKKARSTRLLLAPAVFHTGQDTTKIPRIRSVSLRLVGGVAQWLERRSLAGDFPCPGLDLRLMDDH